jgi:hypothetical protein
MKNCLRIFLLLCTFVFSTIYSETYPYICKPEDRESRPCTREWRAVCGWFSTNIRCERYPCVKEFGNVCVACQDKNVKYVTERCPNLA